MSKRTKLEQWAQKGRTVGTHPTIDLRGKVPDHYRVITSGPKDGKFYGVRVHHDRQEADVARYRQADSRDADFGTKHDVSDKESGGKYEVFAHDVDHPNAFWDDEKHPRDDHGRFT